MRRPRLTVGAIIEKDGKILLAKRNHEPFKDYWYLPGGHVEIGETAEQAIIREVKEETNLDFKPKFFMYVDEIIPKFNWYALSINFYGKAKGKLKISDELKEVRWVKPEEALKMKLAFEDRKLLKAWIKYKKKRG